MNTLNIDDDISLIRCCIRDTCTILITLVVVEDTALDEQCDKSAAKSKGSEEKHLAPGLVMHHSR